MGGCFKRMVNAISVAFSFAEGQSQSFASFLSLSFSFGAPLFPRFLYVCMFFSLAVFASLCLLVSLHKFVSSQKCGEIVVSLCVCPSARTTPFPCLCGWHLALVVVVVVVFGPGLIYAHFVLWPKNAMRCTVNVLVSPRRLLCTALRPPPTLTHTHIRVYTHSLVVYTIKRKAC